MGELRRSALKNLDIQDEKQDFVVAIMSLDESGQTICEAFELTDQFVELESRRYLLPPEKPNEMRFKEDVMVGNKETKVVENDWFFKPVPIIDHAGKWTTGFPVENREQQPQQREDLAEHLRANSSKPFIEQISDPHLIVYLYGQLGLQEVAPLAMAIASK